MRVQHFARLQLLFTLFILASASLGAQTRPASAQPQFKGILEPVSYSEDLDLLHVYFVNGDVGWVGGKSGTILRTVDAGKTWEAQLGGDPESQAPRINGMYFLDERRGWAVQGEAGVTFKMLHTRDGESWEEIGTMPFGASQLVFTSPLVGFVNGNPGMSVSGSNYIFRTTDGGRTWKEHWTCQAKVNVAGINKNISCIVGQIQFPTPDVGYVAVGNGCMGMGCGGPPLLAKTTDGGETWTVMSGPGAQDDEVSSLFFLDDMNGFVRLTSKKLHVTSDGGATWRGLVASPGESIKFADPMVGWAIAPGYSDLRLSFTTDGGKRWNDREVRLPTTIRAFSLPRRDRAYIVGSNGMIFRYSVVPASRALGANDKPAPAMPGFESPLDEQIVQLEQIVEQVQTELAAAKADSSASAGTPATDAGSAADSAAVAAEPFDAPLPEPSPFTASCCKKSFSRLEVILGAMAQSLPEFIGKYKNLNLLLAAVRMSAEMPGQYRSVKGGLRAFRKAQDKDAAQAALAGVSAALSAFKQTTQVSMQQQLPPVPQGGDFSPQPAAPAGAAPNAAMSPTNASGAAQNVAGTATDAPKSVVKDSTKAVSKDAVKEAADKAKKGLGSLLRKKKP